MIDIGVHMLDLALWLIGRFDAVSAFGATYNNLRSGDVEEIASAPIKLDDGSMASLEVSWESFASDGIIIALFRTDGGAEISQNKIKIYRRIEGLFTEMTLEVPSIGPHHEWGELITNFIKCIKGEREPS